jgi:two-component system response regulator YesN
LVKVLIVDDDKLARQGLILSIKWEDFGMKVVGEAPNGLKALQFLDDNPVDLVLTDLAMPVMSGIELMKQARVKHRQVLFVVLTFHEDFETTREALRLGAIDYISKLQLEKENLDAVLGRVRDRIAGDQVQSPRAGGTSALAFFAVGAQARASQLAQVLSEESAELEEIGSGAFLWYSPAGSAAADLWDEWQTAPPPLPGWFVVRLGGLLGESRSRIGNLLRQYQGCALFYDHEPARHLLDLRFDLLDQEKVPAPSEAVLGSLRADLLSMEWMHQGEAFAALKAALRSQRLPYLNLIRLLAAVESEWNRTYGPWATQGLALPEAFHVFTEVEAWLEGIRDFTYSFAPLKSQSREAQASVLRALRILHTEYDRPLHAAEIAQRVHMSRSHFCFCFKEIVGEPFLDYLSQVRVDRAKDLLTRFDWAVYEVAARTGYSDDRYFSRLFKKATGLLPTEYRKKHAR